MDGAEEPVVVRRWPHQRAPEVRELDVALKQEGLVPHWWSNGPGLAFREHSHGQTMLLYCALGSVTFVISPTGERLDLRPGDRIEIPATVRHSAFAGPRGVSCVEGYR